MGSTNQKQQLIDSIAEYGGEHNVDRKFLESKTIIELQTILSDAWTKYREEQEDQMLQARAEAAAQHEMASLAKQQWHEMHKPEHEAKQQEQLESDKKTFGDAARTLHFGQTEANLNVIRQIVGTGFSVYEVQHAVAAGTIHLSPATQQELNQREQERIQARNNYLKNLDPQTLRTEAKKEAEANRAAAQQANAASQLQSQLQRSQEVGFPPLPEVSHTGEQLNGAFFVRLSNTDIGSFKNFIRRYGAAQVTAAIRERK